MGGGEQTFGSHPYIYIKLIARLFRNRNRVTMRVASGGYGQILEQTLYTRCQFSGVGLLLVELTEHKLF